MLWFSALGSKTSAIPLKNPERVRGGRGAGGIVEQPETRGSRRVKREEIWSGRKEGRMFVNEGGAKALHWQRGPDGPGSTVEIYKLEEPEEEDKALIGVGSPEGAGMQQEKMIQE